MPRGSGEGNGGRGELNDGLVVSSFRWKADCAFGSAVIARCKPAPRRAEAVREALAQKEKEETRRRRWSSRQRRTALDALLLPALRTTFHLLLRETAATEAFTASYSQFPRPEHPVTHTNVPWDLGCVF